MAIAVVAILLNKYPLQQIIGASKNVDWSWFLAYSFVFFLTILLLDCFSVSRLFSRFGFPTSFKEMMHFRLASYLPMILNYGVGQGFLAYFFKKRKKAPFSVSSSLILFVFIVDIYWTFSFACIGSFLSDLTVGSVNLSYFIRAIWSAATIALLVLILAFKFPLKRARPSDYGVLAIMRLPMHIAVNTTLFFIAPMFGSALPFVKVISYQPVVTLIGAIPITPGGIGTVQLATAEFYKNFVSDPSLLVSMSLLFMAANFALQAITGAFFIKEVLRSEKEAAIL